MKIKYKLGDATNPTETGKVMIGHSVNTWGMWGAGFVLPLAKRYPEAREQYLSWSIKGYYNFGKNKVLFRLGEFQPVKISDNLYVGNIIAQSGCGNLKWLIPFRYESFEEALIRLEDYLVRNKFNYFVVPRIGCGLGGASIEKVVEIIEKCISIQCIVYDREQDEWPGTIYENE